MNIEELTHVYLVKRRGGEYDDKWQSTICARARKEDAEGMVAAANAHDEYLRGLDARFRAHMAAWTPKIVALPYPEMVPQKKWPPGLGKADITQQMRDERAAVNVENERRMVPYRENQEQIYLERTNEEIRYLVEVEGLTREAAEDKINNTFGSWRAPDEDVVNYVSEVPFAS